MRKNKTWEITLTNNSRLIANEPIENAIVYTTDTEAYLNFRVIDSGFEFDSATIAMLNKDDGSIVERSMVKEDDTAVYEIESDIIPHFGLWQAQVLFQQGEEIFTSNPVTLTIERYMMSEQPPRLEDVASWQRLYDNAVETIQELTKINDDLNTDVSQAITDLTTTNQAVQEAENSRASAEEERKANETERVNAEIIRVAQEEERKRLWEKAIKDPRIFGVLWDKTSSPTMTRTDDAVGLVANIGIGSEYARNDCDNLPIFRDMYRTTDDYGNLFVHIPKFYIKKKSGTGFYQLQISEVQHGGFYLPECFIDQETGRELDYILVGAYNANLSADGTRLESKKGNLPHVNNNIVQFRNLAKANGAGYQQMDIHVIDVIQMLFRVEFATLHSQSVHPGYTQGSEATESGLGDGILASSGATANNGLVPFVYRGIENPWGNVYQFVDGININNHQVWVARDARQYASNVFASPYEKLGYTNYDVENGYPTEMGYDPALPFAEFPIALGGNSATYYADYYYQATGQRIAQFGGRWSYWSFAGLSFWSLSYSSGTASASLGGRLLKKPL